MMNFEIMNDVLQIIYLQKMMFKYYCILRPVLRMQ
jgi:hypothetical protein